MAYGSYRSPDAGHLPPRKPSGLDYASFGLDLLGTGLGAFGTYQAAEMAEEQFEEEKRRYEDEKAYQRQMDEWKKQQQILQNTMGYGNYARQMEQDVYGTYSPYARRSGL